MEKYFGLAVAALFLIFWAVKRFRRPKVTEAGAIPTGISNWTYLLVGFSLLVGVIVVIFGGKELMTEVGHENEWKKTIGVVEAHAAGGTRKGRSLYRAQFSFNDETGNTHQATDSEADRNPPAVGNEIRVIYDPGFPENARIDSFESRWLKSILMFVFGIAALFFVTGAVKQILKIKSAEPLGAPLSQATRVEGTYIESKKNFFLSLRHSKSWRIIAEYRDLAGRVHRFESEPVWEYDPSDWAKADVKVPIQVDRMNASRGWIRVQDYFQACKSM